MCTSGKDVSEEGADVCVTADDVAHMMILFKLGQGCDSGDAEQRHLH